jgi:hypothetical protein
VNVTVLAGKAVILVATVNVTVLAGKAVISQKKNWYFFLF